MNKLGKGGRWEEHKVFKDSDFYYSFFVSMVTKKAKHDTRT